MKTARFYFQKMSIVQKILYKHCVCLCVNASVRSIIYLMLNITYFAAIVIRFYFMGRVYFSYFCQSTMCVIIHM